MKIILTAINAKYIHSTLALPSIKAYSKDTADFMEIMEFTINNSDDFIIKKLFYAKPDILCFSCYIWNISIIKRIASYIKKLFPNIIMVFGGPEVSYDSEIFMRENEFVDVVISGEGEKTFKELSEFYIYKKKDLESIKGITYKKGNFIFKNEPQTPISLDEIPFVYEDTKNYENRIIYYETQRGCPYNCQYCLSSVEKGVRFLSEKRVKSDLNFFIKNNIKQVKFVDRTFNCNRSHAIMIWKYIMENDNGITNFHMEITGDILDDEIINILKSARKGLFQFEIGIQSTNIKTLEAIKRKTDLKKLWDKIKLIQASKNIHCHLDLIAGLPYENYISFKKSFNDVYMLMPEQLQLGFLKMLKGSGLRKNSSKFGIVYKHEPPYEILFTKELSYYDVLKLKNIEDIVEIYYNSGKALNTLKFCLKFFESPFDFYEALGNHWEEKGYFNVNHSKMEVYQILFEFLKSSEKLCDMIDIIISFLRLDIFTNDNIKTIPPEFYREQMMSDKERIRKFYNDKEKIKLYMPNLLDFTPKQLDRMCHIEMFDFDVLEASKQPLKEISKKQTAVLFNYWERDNILNKAAIYKVNL